jgi:hypothetical protein
LLIFDPSNLQKFAYKLQICLKLDKNIEPFKWKIKYVYIFNTGITYLWGSGVTWWLRRCATSRTVPGSIPGSVNGFFSDIFPSDHTMALGSTQPLVKMSTRKISCW